MTPTTILVWYFLSAAGNNVATQGPFTSKDQCNEFVHWTRNTTWASYVSECYSAPLAQPQRPQGEYCSKGCKDE